MAGAADDPCCSRQPNYSVSQSPDEMEFERGIWKPAMEGDIKRVERLLAKGNDVNTRDSAGYTPLLYAARNGHYNICEILLKYGADVNAFTPSIHATPLHRAASQSHPDVVDTLLRHGADANLTDVDGKTALHRAIPELGNRFENARDVCRKLLMVTDPTIKDNSGKTAKDAFKQHYLNIDHVLSATDALQSEQKPIKVTISGEKLRQVDALIEEITKQEKDIFQKMKEIEGTIDMEESKALNFETIKFEALKKIQDLMKEKKKETSL